jgi:opacity protein-like surface antigen
VAFLVTLAPCGLPAQKALAQQPPARHGLWIAFGLGGGRVERWSHEAPATRTTTVTASLRGGVTLAPTLRLGIEANGWGLETSNPNDPARGVTINETLIIAQFYPWPALGWYLKGGIGLGGYNTHHANDWGSSSFGAWALGAGYEMRVSRTVAVTLAADWAQGPTGSVANLVTTSIGRRFRAWDLILGVQYH